MLKAKFKVGQKVYAVTRQSDTRMKHVECDVCNSTGWVKIECKDGRFTCPECHGRMTTEDYGFKYIIAYRNAEIGRVEILEYSPKYKGMYKSEVKYMLEQTGVGSGQVWKEERLFATEEEAKEFCEKYVPFDYYDTRAILKT